MNASLFALLITHTYQLTMFWSNEYNYIHLTRRNDLSCNTLIIFQTENTCPWRIARVRRRYYPVKMYNNTLSWPVAIVEVLCKNLRFSQTQVLDVKPIPNRDGTDLWYGTMKRCPRISFHRLKILAARTLSESSISAERTILRARWWISSAAAYIRAQRSI